MWNNIFPFEGPRFRGKGEPMNFQIYFSRERGVPRRNLIPRFPPIFTRTTTSRRSFGAAQSAISHVLPYSTNSRTRSARRPGTQRILLFSYFPAWNRPVVAFARRSIGLRICSSVETRRRVQVKRLCAFPTSQHAERDRAESSMNVEQGKSVISHER